MSAVSMGQHIAPTLSDEERAVVLAAHQAVTPLTLLLVVQLMVAEHDRTARTEAAGYGYWSGYQDARDGRPYGNTWRGEVDSAVDPAEVRRG